MTARCWVTGGDIVIRGSGGEVRIPIGEAPDLVARVIKLVLSERTDWDEDATPVEVPTRAGRR